MKAKMIFSLLIAALLISACGGQTPPAPAPEPVVEEAQPVDEASPPEGEQPAPEQPVAQPAEETGMMAYTSPQGLFDLEIPNGWANEKNTGVIENTVVETYTSPDGNAFVQVVVSDSGFDVSNVEKAQITRDFMKRLYGSDLRFATDVSLSDGRERLEWWSDENDTSGTTYFHRIKNYLFFYTTSYKDDFEKDYMSILDEVNESYYSKEG